MSVGTNIKKRRYELRLSQQELAEAMGYKTRSTIAKIESGENDVSQKKLQRFAAVLDTTPEALISGLAPQKPAPGQTIQDGIPQNRSIAIILAGGKTGSGNIPSQFVSIHGKPVLVYTMEVYQHHPSIDEIYVVCLKGWENIVKAYARQYGIFKLKGMILGGSSGVDSLKNAFDYLTDRCADEDLILIQEATRPMVTADTVSRLLLSCAEKGSATICHRMQEYVQFRMDGQRPQYVDRNDMIALQSPEAHSAAKLREVFARAKQLGHPLTESCCTMLMYHLGYDINFVESPVNNIKIVREEDLAAFGAKVKT